MKTTPSLDARLRACERPDARVVMYQQWTDLLFLHWEIDPALIQETLPPGLHVDTHEGTTYLGLVPFFMRNIRPRFCPPAPGISKFLEMNVRTYVHDDRGRPGVWFYSLDANQSLAVALAQRLFHLPYLRADMAATHSDDGISYSCHRRGTPPEEASAFLYQAMKELPRPAPGSLEFFLLERYLLFAHDRKRARLLSGQVHHAPYPVHQVAVDKFSPIAIQQAGFSIPESSFDHAVLSPGVAVEIFGIETVREYESP